MDAGSSPGRVLGHHLEDQIANFLRNALPAAGSPDPGDRFPIESKSSTVPTHNSFWTHDQESLFPSGPEPSRQDPEELIEHRQPWTWMSSIQCRELLSKGEVFN